MASRLATPACKLFRTLVVGAFVCPCVIWAQRAPTSNERANTNAGSTNSHSLAGIWGRASRIQVFSDQPPAFTAEGQAKFNANKPGYGPRSVPPALGNDAMGTCDPLGIPRLLTLEVLPPYHRVEIFETSNRMLQHFEWHNYWREIWTDGRELPKDPEPKWMGYSVGKWEGDAFVVNSFGFDGRTWLDHFGYPHSDEMRLQERYRLLDHDTLELTMTITDPRIYAKPWSSDKKILKLVPKGEIEESFCVPTEEQEFNNTVRNPAGGVTNKK